MVKKRTRISDGATFEEVQAFLLRLTRTLRTMAPRPQVTDTLDWIEADVEQMIERDKGQLLHN